ncbi:Aorsin [Pseudocercospora fuligena]|uniref:Aorsin n=1 Tax=Pseudocercospora fuligena TaxID=685502 RepID=A0A8H6RTU7_9PEZI|nr:Aorsin [Pseudocercospora fuligena]
MPRCNLFWSLALIILETLSGNAIIPDTHVVHEKRLSHHAWSRNGRVHSRSIVPLRIALTQQNLDDETGYQKLMEVSDPDSPRYGQYLSSKEVHSMFAPSADAAKDVSDWLIEAGIDQDDILEFENKAWLAAHIPAEKFEQLFHAELHEYEHKATGELKIGCDVYHVPERIRKHIDYVTPGVALSARVRKRNAKQSDFAEHSLQRRALHASHMILEDSGDGNDQPPVNAADLRKDLSDCGRNITIPCLRALYGIPKPTKNDSVNSLGMFENFYSYAQEDLDEFYTRYHPEIPNGTHPITISVNGGAGPANRTAKENGGEPELDIQAALPLIYPQTITIYQVEDPPQAALQINQTLPGYLNTFLDSLDGSYCNYCAFGVCGDDPVLDAVYPDERPGGFKQPRQCGVYNLTRVLSISYGQGEQDLPVAYTRRQCNEFMKLALQGHTIMASSGDFGVASFPNDTGTAKGCLSGCGFNDTFYKPGDNCPYKDLKGKVFHPSNPGNCPWILSVGGTALFSNQTILDSESAMEIYFPNNSVPATSGGGFSNYFSRPEYQKKAVDAYFEKHDPGYKYYFADTNVSNIGNNGGVYNRGGRGYPDVSANGANFRGIKWRKSKNGTIATDARFFGSSLSAPIWGAMITLINEERTAIGKGPVGFVQPVLYKHPEIFNDITNGTSDGCGTSGFKAVEGWDPITGLGTPNFPKMLEVFMKLP